MRLVLVCAGGVVVHVASFVLAEYAQWLLSKVIGDGGGSWSVMDDLWLFLRRLLLGLAELLCDRRLRQPLDAYEDGLQPGYFGSR
jgi:hypothetical protein